MEQCADGCTMRYYEVRGLVVLVLPSYLSYVKGFSRDRLAFSKSILRRFIRDCVDRDAAVASPWTVKPVIAARYGVNTVMPEEIRVGVETIKKGEIDKRKKVWEDKEGPAQKKRRQMAEEKGTSVVDPPFPRRNTTILNAPEYS